MVYVGLIIWVLSCALIFFSKKISTNALINKLSTRMKFGKEIILDNKKCFLIFVFSLMAIIMGLRGESVGIDTKNYKMYFEIVSSTDFLTICSHFYTSSMEIGYVLLMKVCSLVLNDYFFFQIVFAIIFSYLSGKFLYDNSDNVVITTVVFLGIGIYAITFNIARQMLAVMIVANSWTHFRKKEFIKSTLLILLASTIHITSLLFFIADIIYLIRNKNIIIKIIPIIIIFCATEYKLLLLIFERIYVNYRNYFSNTKAIQTAGFVWGLWIITLALAIWIIYFGHIDDKENSIISIYCIIWVAANIVGLSFNYFERLGLYFIPFIPLMFSCFVEYIKDVKAKKLYLLLMDASFIIYFLISVMNSRQYIYITFIK